MMTDEFERKSIATEAGEIVYFSGPVFPGRPTVLCLHGLSANHTTWRRLMRHLVARQFNVIAPDLRGHGYSDKTRRRALCTIERTASDVAAILKAEGVSRAHIVGYSWGGLVALELATTTEYAQSLILVSTNHRSPLVYTPYRIVARAAYWLPVLVGYVVIWQRRRAYFYFDQDVSTGYWESTFTGFLTMPISVNLWMLSAVLDADFHGRLGTISCPVAMLYGENDPFLSEREVKEMAEEIPNATTVRMGAGHFLGSRESEALAEKILGILDTQI